MGRIQSRKKRETESGTSGEYTIMAPRLKKNSWLKTTAIKCLLPRHHRPLKKASRERRRRKNAGNTSASEAH